MINIGNIGCAPIEKCLAVLKPLLCLEMDTYFHIRVFSKYSISICSLRQELKNPKAVKYVGKFFKIPKILFAPPKMKKMLQN